MSHSESIYAIKTIHLRFWVNGSFNRAILDDFGPFWASISREPDFFRPWNLQAWFLTLFTTNSEVLNKFLRVDFFYKILRCQKMHFFVKFWMIQMRNMGDTMAKSCRPFSSTIICNMKSIACTKLEKMEFARMLPGHARILDGSISRERL